MQVAIFGIISSLLKLVATIVGDNILAKWVSQVKLWYRQWQEPAIKAKIEEQYNKLSQEWDQLQQDRKPGPRG